MTRDDILSVLERQSAAWAARDPAALASTYAPHATVTSPTGGVLEGPEEIERIYRKWFQAFPDLRFHAEDVLIDGDRVVQIARVSGTHAGEFFGVAATGRKVDVKQEDFRVEFTGLPEKAPEQPVTTIEVECDGEPVQDTDWVRKERPRRGVGI